MEAQFSRIAEDVELGKDVRIFGWANLYGCKIGDRSRVGTFVEIQKDSTIGCDVKIQSHTFICSGVQIDDEAFIGHGVMFINDKYPRSTNVDGSLQTESDWECQITKIGKRVSLGSNSTILGGISIGENSIVGAGSVVTKNIPANCIAVGNPARVVRSLNE